MDKPEAYRRPIVSCLHITRLTEIHLKAIVPHIKLCVIIVAPEPYIQLPSAIPLRGSMFEPSDQDIKNIQS